MVTLDFLISNIPPDDSNVLVRIGSAKTTFGSKVLVTGERAKRHIRCSFTVQQR